MYATTGFLIIVINEFIAGGLSACDVIIIRDGKPLVFLGNVGNTTGTT